MSNFQPIRLLDPDCWYKFAYIMANSADPDHMAWCGSALFAKQNISGFSRTRVKRSYIFAPILSGHKVFDSAVYLSEIWGHLNSSPYFPKIWTSAFYNLLVCQTIKHTNQKRNSWCRIANGRDIDQTPPSAASYLDIQCLRTPVYLST